MTEAAAGALNHTHDAARRSWVLSANRGTTDFPLQNLPFGIFRRRGENPRGGIAIGDQIFDLAAGVAAGLFSGAAYEAAVLAAGPVLNPLLAGGLQPASALRSAVFELLAEGAPGSTETSTMLVAMRDAELLLPVAVGGFTDFLSSYHHTMRMGGGNLPAAFSHLPIAYNGRASSVRRSGEPVRRPNGLFRDVDGTVRFGAEPMLDYELELGAFVGPGTALGTSLTMAEAADRLFGFCLLNDWSARGIQFLESTPLGPFLGKSFSTTISPWLVTAEALAPFRVAAPDRTTEPHLSAATAGGLDIEMEALLLTARMRELGTAPARLTRTNVRECYWTFDQMLTHHASNGCNLVAGDLLGSGTLSGEAEDSRACLAEINQRGSQSFTLENGEVRTWLEDGDEVILRGQARRPGAVTIGFGDCRGIIGP